MAQRPSQYLWRRCPNPSPKIHVDLELNPMKRTFYLIENTSGCTYWSYKLTPASYIFDPFHQQAVDKYGEIYVNRNNGWFCKLAIKKIIKQVSQSEFPQE